MKREAKITPEIEKYLIAKKIYGLIEVKQTTTDIFHFNKFESHQFINLVSAISNGLLHKISDADPRLKPGDIIHLPPLNSWVVIKFPECICFIMTRSIKSQMDLGITRISVKQAREISAFILLR